MAVESPAPLATEVGASDTKSLPVVLRSVQNDNNDSDQRARDSVTNSSDNKLDDAAKPDEQAKFQPTLQFWLILATLCVIGLLSALENTVVTTSLPFIVSELGLGENYIWVTNVFFLTR